MSELLPCPFCGQKLIKNGPFSKRNADCFVHPQDVAGVDYGLCPAAGFRLFSDDDERVALWNRRAPTASPESLGVSQDAINPLPQPVAWKPDREAVAHLFYRAQLGSGDDFTRTPLEWADAILALGSPPGWKLVPVEPTEEMHAALTALGRAMFSDAHERDQFCWFAVKAYRAMLSASLLPGGGEGNQELISSVADSGGTAQAPKSDSEGGH